jgi:hypothetical protein
MKQYNATCIKKYLFQISLLLFFLYMPLLKTEDFESELLLFNGDLKSLNTILRRPTCTGLKEILQIKAEIEAEIAAKREELHKRSLQSVDVETLEKNIQELWEQHEANEALLKYWNENCR